MDPSVITLLRGIGKFCGRKRKKYVNCLLYGLNAGGDVALLTYCCDEDC